MSGHVRRLVFGANARLMDHGRKPDLNLDLSYVTDNVIVMAYPAPMVGPFYRNLREDAKRFLDALHGKNYWIYNLCPMNENAYDPAFFEGRVSRYPFPDHHVPPLAMMPLVVREMRAWLSASPKRVAVLHCKAGKGRSGTMACSYLLSLDELPKAPQWSLSYDAMHGVQRNLADSLHAISLNAWGSNAAREAPAFGNQPASMNMSIKDKLKFVLDLHTARRMRQHAGTIQGVSIPSQRRWLFYWALILAQEAPTHLWALNPISRGIFVPAVETLFNRPKVRITQVLLKMVAPSKLNREPETANASNVVSDHAKPSPKKKKKATHKPATHDEYESMPVWASLARYDDEFIEELEKWEKLSRDTKGRMGHGRNDPKNDSELAQSKASMFDETGRWDKPKMVESIQRMVDIKKEEEIVKDQTIWTYHLCPLRVKETQTHDGTDAADRRMEFELSDGFIVDAARELQMMICRGEDIIGWVWMIPTFHLPPPPSPYTHSQHARETHTLTLPREEIDFVINIEGDIDIIDMSIAFEWVTPTDVCPVLVRKAYAPTTTTTARTSHSHP